MIEYFQRTQSARAGYTRPWPTIVMSTLAIMGCAGASVGSTASPAPAVMRTPVPFDTLVHRYGYVRVALTRLGGLYTMPVTIGGRTKDLVFDSGMGEDLALVTSFADVMGVRGVAGRDRVGFGAPVPADTTHLATLRIDTLTLEPLFLKISANDPPGGTGALGAHVASRYHFIVDYTQDALYLHAPAPPGTETPPGAAPRPDDIAIPLTRLVKGTAPRVRYVLHATINGVAVLLALDTGADVSLAIDQQRLRDFGLDPTASSTVQGIGGTQDARTGRLDSVMIGSLNVGPLYYTALDMSAANQRGQEEGFPKLDGIVGAGTLDAHGAIIDFGHNVLYLRRQ